MKAIDTLRRYDVDAAALPDCLMHGLVSALRRSRRVCQVSAVGSEITVYGYATLTRQRLKRLVIKAAGRDLPTVEDNPF